MNPPPRKFFTVAKTALCLCAIAYCSVATAQETYDFDQDLNGIWTSYQSQRYEDVQEQVSNFINQYREDEKFPNIAKKVFYLDTLAAVRLQDWQRAIDSAKGFEHFEGEALDSWREEMLFWKGYGEFKVGHQSWSRATLEEFIERFPTSKKLSASVFTIGSSFIHEQKFQEAAQFFGSVKSQLNGTDRGRATLLQLMALQKTGEIQSATELVKDAYTRLNEFPQVAALQTIALSQANQLISNNEPRKAIAILKKIQPRDAVVALQKQRLEDLELRQQQLSAQDADAVEATQLQELISTIRHEIEQFGKIVDFDANVQFQTAGAWLKLKRYREAAFILDKMLHDLPPNPVSESAIDTLVKCHAEIRRWPKVISTANHFREKYPESQFLPGIEILKGQALLETRDYQAAIRTFDEVVQNNPEHELAAHALFLKGFAHAVAEEYDSAQMAFSSVLENYPGHGIAEKAMYWIGNSQSMAQEYEASIVSMQQYLDKYPDHEFTIEAIYRIAFANHVLGDYDKSVPQLYRFTEQYPNDINTAEALLLLGEAKLAEAEFEEGIRLLKSVPKGVNSYAEEAWFKIGKAYRMNEEIDRMREHFQEFQEEFPESARVAEAVYWLGWTEKDHPGKVYEIYFDALEQHGNNIDQWGITQIIAGLEKNIESPEDIEQHAARLQALGQKAKAENKSILESRIYYALGLLHQKHTPQESAKWMAQALELTDIRFENPALLIDIADSLSENGDVDRAKELYADIRRWNPVTPVRDRVYLALAEISLEQGDDVAAKEFLERFIREVPSSKYRVEVEIRLADLLAQNGETADAIEKLETQLARKNLSKRMKVGILMRIGDIYSEAGNPKKAFPYFQRVYVLYAGFQEEAAEAYLKSGMALEELGEGVGAARTYMEFLNIEDEFVAEGNETVEAIRERLEALPETTRQQAIDEIEKEQQKLAELQEAA